MPKREATEKWSYKDFALEWRFSSCSEGRNVRAEIQTVTC